jgi:hypothetical protein
MIETANNLYNKKLFHVAGCINLIRDWIALQCIIFTSLSFGYFVGTPQSKTFSLFPFCRHTIYCGAILFIEYLIYTLCLPFVRPKLKCFCHLHYVCPQCHLVMHLVLIIKILQILSTKPAQHRQYRHYATERITEELWFSSLQGLFNQQFLKQIILARKTWMQTWKPELHVHSFHLQNTFSGDRYRKGRVSFKWQNLSLLLQGSVLSAAGNLTALFHIFTYLT